VRENVVTDERAGKVLRRSDWGLRADNCESVRMNLLL
jgi:hypothetical protein